MKRGFAVAVVALVSLAGGCAAPARYVEKGNNQGVVGVPIGTDGRASEAHRREAIGLIEKHVGPNYDIVADGPVRPAAGTAGGATETAEWRIAYRKAVEGAPAGGAPADLVPSVGPGAGPSGPPRANAGRQILSGGAGTHMMSSGGGPRHTEGFPSGLRPAGGSQ